MLAGLGQSGINKVALRLGLEDEIPVDTNLSIAKKCDLLGRIVVRRHDVILDTLKGCMTLGEAVVRQAAETAKPDPADAVQTAFVRGLARDG